MPTAVWANAQVSEHTLAKLTRADGFEQHKPIYVGTRATVACYADKSTPQVGQSKALTLAARRSLSSCVHAFQSGFAFHVLIV